MGRKTSTTADQDIEIYGMRENGLTYESISRKMGITISTARRAYKRALEAEKSTAMEQVMEYVYGDSQETEEIFQSALASGNIEKASKKLDEVTKVTFVSKVKNFFSSLIG